MFPPASKMLGLHVGSRVDLLIGGNAAFLMANVTLLGWIAALAARLTAVHGHTELKPPDQPAAI